MKNRAAALASAAIVTVYAAGYVRTKPSADRLALAAERRPAQVRTAGSPASTALVERATPSSNTPRLLEVPARPIETPSGTKPPTDASHEKSIPPAKALQEAPAASAPVTSDGGKAVASESAEPATPPAIVEHPAESAETVATAQTVQYKDGTYTGWGSCRHGDIQAAVLIQGGRIAGASISQCLTRYSCSWIASLVPQVGERQSAEVDVVSGATESSDAFYDAVIDALAKAK